MTRYPRTLAPVELVVSEELAHNAASALGKGARASQALVAAGLVPPDALAVVTLMFLTGQPRGERPRESSRSAPEKKRSAVAGSVWVREQYTIHGPVRIGEPLVARGEVSRQSVRSGRIYSTTVSQTRSADGAPRVTGCTTGLVRYRRDETLVDREEGRAEADVSVPRPDATAAAENPARDALRALCVGDVIRGPATEVTLDMMRVRDGGQSRNPIHTDPEAARRAGLPAPIAGGAHVLGFLLETLMQAWGSEALLYGACFDVRFTSQVRAGAAVEPFARVAAATEGEVGLDLRVDCEGRVAMRGTLVVPREGAVSA